MTAPIACTLSSGDYVERARWITDLNRSALRTHARVGRTLTLTYASTASASVRTLASQEAQCCAFLEFEVREAPDSIQLLVIAPAAVGETFDPIFASLLAGAEPTLGKVGGKSSAAEGVAQCGPACSCSSTNAPTTPATRGTYGTTLLRSRDRIPGAAAAAAGAAALACGVCCVLPLALPAAAMTAAGGTVAMFADAYPWALAVSVVLTAAGWLWVFWESARTRRRPATSTLRIMAVATLLVGLALSWPRLEPLARRALGG